MQITKTHRIIISAVVVLILLSIYIIFDRKTLKAPSGSVDINATVTPTKDTNVGITGNGYKIEQVPINEGKVVSQPVPDLNRLVALFPGVTIAPEAKVLAEKNILSLQTRLKADTKDVNAWIDLATNQKNAGDYAGAVISLKYANYLAPTDYVSIGNLANLYAYFIHDNAQAEIYYKKAIEKGPVQAYLYAQLADVYKDIFKDLDKARTIINQGLSKVPNDPLLLQFQASLK